MPREQRAPPEADRRRRPQDAAAAIAELRERLADSSPSSRLAADEVQRIRAAVSTGQLADVGDLTSLAQYARLVPGVPGAQRGSDGQVAMIVDATAQTRRRDAVTALAELLDVSDPPALGAPAA